MLQIPKFVGLTTFEGLGIWICNLFCRAALTKHQQLEDHLYYQHISMSVPRLPRPHTNGKSTKTYGVEHHFHRYLEGLGHTSSTAQGSGGSFKDGKL